MAWRGGISRILCCCKYMKVVLTCVCSFSVYHCVSLLSFCAFLEGCTAVSLCTCGITGLLLFGGLALIVYIITAIAACLCHEGKCC
jgi:hypothetical protein